MERPCEARRAPLTPWPAAQVFFGPFAKKFPDAEARPARAAAPPRRLSSVLALCPLPRATAADRAGGASADGVLRCAHTPSSAALRRPGPVELSPEPAPELPRCASSPPRGPGAPSPSPRADVASNPDPCYLSRRPLPEAPGRVPHQRRPHHRRARPLGRGDRPGARPASLPHPPPPRPAAPQPPLPRLLAASRPAPPPLRPAAPLRQAVLATPLGIGPYVEAAFFHRASRTLLVTDTVVSVPTEPPEARTVWDGRGAPAGPAPRAARPPSTSCRRADVLTS